VAWVKRSRWRSIWMRRGCLDGGTGAIALLAGTHPQGEDAAASGLRRSAHAMSVTIMAGLPIGNEAGGCAWLLEGKGPPHQRGRDAGGLGKPEISRCTCTGCDGRQ
jgi:hypothetical protein